MLKTNYIAIPLIVLAVSLLGGWLTAGGMGWYETVTLPDNAAPGSVIGSVWTALYVLIAIALLLLWNKTKHTPRFWLIIVVWVVNGLANVAWSLLFFRLHWLWIAGFDAALLLATAVILMVVTWRHSKFASVLLLPYVAWLTYAMALAVEIAVLN